MTHRRGRSPEGPGPAPGYIFGPSRATPPTHPTCVCLRMSRFLCNLGPGHAGLGRARTHALRCSSKWGARRKTADCFDSVEVASAHQRCMRKPVSSIAQKLARNNGRAPISARHEMKQRMQPFARSARLLGSTWGCQPRGGMGCAQPPNGVGNDFEPSIGPTVCTFGRSEDLRGRVPTGASQPETAGTDRQARGPD